METQTKIVSGGISILLLLAAGFMIMPDDTHFCRSTELSMECDRLSSTNVTCYPTNGTTKGYKRCSGGWIEIDREINESGNEIKGVELSEKQTYLLCEKTNELITECQELNSERVVYKVD